MDDTPETQRLQRSARRWREVAARLDERRLALEAQDRVVELGAVSVPAAGLATGPAEAPVGADAVSPGMRTAAAWSWRVIVVAAAASGVVWVVWELRLVTLPLVAAVLLAALLQPVVRRLRRWGLGRGSATALTVVGFLTLVFFVLGMAGQSFGGQFVEIRDSAIDGLERVQEWFVSGPAGLSEAQVDEWVGRFLDLLRANSLEITSGALSTAAVAAELLTGGALAIFALIFFLYDGDAIWAWTVRLLPARAEARADHAGRLAWVTLTGYVRGTILIALFDGVFITVLLLILQVPLALPLGVLVFFGAFVPVVGAFITGALAVLVALVTVSPLTALLVLAGIVAIQQLESQIFQPFVLGRLVRLHPLAVVLAIAVGALVAGIAGAVVAVPTTAVLNTVVSYLAGRRGGPDADADAGAGEARGSTDPVRADEPPTPPGLSV